jgi:hypothetical protein
MRARLQSLDPRRTDVLLTIAVLAEFLFEVFVFVPADAPHRWVAAVAVTAGALGLGFRRTAPLAAATPCSER